jgi:hypothetical protein
MQTIATNNIGLALWAGIAFTCRRHSPSQKIFAKSAAACSTLVMVLAAGWPGSLPAWTPGTYPVASYNFTVDSQSRNDVVAFWHGVYQASEGYQDRHAWSGNYTAAAPYDSGVGTTAAAFITDVERRLNFYRALCQIPANARLNTGATVQIDADDPYHATSTPALAAATTKDAASQRAAYMVIRTYGYSLGGVAYPGLGGNPTAAISHTPPDYCIAWTTAAWNANHHGCIALGFYGPGALDSYMCENVSNVSNWNTAVGHRRWLLYPGSTNFASGDTPGAYDISDGKVHPPTNVLYAIPKTAEVANVTPQFVAYPPAGYFPAALNSPYWSLSYPGAGFGSASVTMTNASGAAVAAVICVRGDGYGNPAIMWQVSGAAAATTVTADTRYNVTVSGMTGINVPASYSYSVTLINPNQLTDDLSLSGTSTPSTSAATTYQLSPPPQAEALQVNCFQPVATAWTEGAEDSPTPGVIANTAASYAFLSAQTFTGFTGFTLTGAKSFRLTIPVLYDPRLNAVPDQSFELDRDILAGAGATLNFNFRRGYMTNGTCLAVETSSNGGVSWSQLSGGLLVGNDNAAPDPDASSPTHLTLPLATSAVPIRVRFRLFVTGWFYADQYDYRYNYDFKNLPTGIFIDDINTSNCQWLELKKTNTLAATATSFVLNPGSAGMTLADNLELRLRLRAKLGNRWMPYGPLKALTLTAQSTYATWINSYFTGISDLSIISPAADPDHDGQANLLEFALGSTPASGSKGTKVYNLIPVEASGAGSKQLLLTIAVRTATPTFSGAPAPHATHSDDAITYTVQGGLTLDNFTSPVSVVNPPVTTGLPSPPANYEYRTFKLDASDDLTGQGFLRVLVAMPP